MFVLLFEQGLDLRPEGLELGNDSRLVGTLRLIDRDDRRLLINVFVNCFGIHIALLCGLGIIVNGTKDSLDFGLFPGLDHGLTLEEKIESTNENLRMTTREF